MTEIFWLVVWVNLAALALVAQVVIVVAVVAFLRGFFGAVLGKANPKKKLKHTPWTSTTEPQPERDKRWDIPFSPTDPSRPPGDA